MSRPIRWYSTVFVQTDGLQVAFETMGVTPCAAKQVGFLLLERHLRDHPELPVAGWRVGSHTPASETPHA